MLTVTAWHKTKPVQPVWLKTTVANYFNGEGRRVNGAQLSAALKAGRIHVYRENTKCHSQSFRESGAQSTDWLLAGARLWGLDTELLPWMLLPKLVPSCRRLMWRITAVALKACCEEGECDKTNVIPKMPGETRTLFMSKWKSVSSFTTVKHERWRPAFSPSTCFWQSFSASVDWLIRVCSCREPCLQQSWKWESSHFELLHYYTTDLYLYV